MTNIVTDIGWTLIYFIWQGLLIAGALRLFLASLPAQASTLRYAAAYGSLWLCLLTCLITFLSINHVPSVPSIPSITVEPPSPTFPLSGLPQTLYTSHWQAQAEPWLAWAVVLWVIGVLVGLLRFSWALLSVHHIVASAGPLTDPIWDARIKKLMGRLGIERSVRILCSNGDLVPMVVGLFKPTILVPLSLITQLTSDELELILAHELAHIRRNDYLANLFQVIIESVLFYHPLVWWISAEVRREREFCCDDLALTLRNDRLLYSKALAHLENCRNSNALSLAASDGSLLQRVKRLMTGRLEPVYVQFDRLAAILGLGGVILLIVMGVSIADKKSPQPYTWKTNIKTTVFWIGKGVTSWEPPASDDQRNIRMPFYVALPFDDLAFPEKAKKWLPPSWSNPAVAGKKPGSACKDRWVEIRNEAGKSCFALWEDVGPLRHDDAEYVFGDERPAGPGLDVSPTVAAYLGINDNKQMTSWRFVDAEDVPPGKWMMREEQQQIISLNTEAVDNQSLYVKAWLDIQNGFNLKSEGDALAAKKIFEEAEQLLLTIQKNDPRWETALVEARQRDCRTVLKDLESGVSSSNVISSPSPIATDPASQYSQAQKIIDSALGLMQQNPLDAKLKLVDAKQLLLNIQKTQPDWKKNDVTAGIQACDKGLAAPEHFQPRFFKDLQTEYVKAWLEIQTGSDDMNKGNPMAAKAYFEDARLILLNIQKTGPDWEAAMVGARIRNCDEQMKKL